METVAVNNVDTCLRSGRWRSEVSFRWCSVATLSGPHRPWASASPGQRGLSSCAGRTPFGLAVAGHLVDHRQEAVGIEAGAGRAHAVEHVESGELLDVLLFYRSAVDDFRIARPELVQ